MLGNGCTVTNVTDNATVPMAESPAHWKDQTPKNNVSCIGLWQRVLNLSEYVCLIYKNRILHKIV